MPEGAGKMPESAGKILNMDDQEKQIINYIKKEGKITSREVEQLLNVKDRRARKILNNMVNRKIIKIKGKGRTTNYIMFEENSM